MADRPDRDTKTPGQGSASPGNADKVRRHYRVPADPEQTPEVEINGELFQVYDVSEGGICHLLSRDQAFQVGDMPRIRVMIAGEEFELDGVVVHVTPHGEYSARCGIMFSAVGPEALGTIRRYVEETRARLFNK